MIKKLLVWWRERHKRRWLKGLALKYGYESYAELQDAAEFSRMRFEEYMVERCAEFAYVASASIDPHPDLSGISPSDSLFRTQSYPACTWKIKLVPKYVWLAGRKMYLTAGRPRMSLAKPDEAVWDPAQAAFEYDAVTFEIETLGVGWLQDSIRADGTQMDWAAKEAEKQIEAWAQAVLADAVKVVP